MIVTIPTDEQDRFQREIIANSPDQGISRSEQDEALHTFVMMYASAGTDTIDGAIIAAWQEHQFQVAWIDGQMAFVLNKPDEPPHE